VPNHVHKPAIPNTTTYAPDCAPACAHVYDTHYLQAGAQVGAQAVVMDISGAGIMMHCFQHFGITFDQPYDYKEDQWLRFAL
jgi:hypothetical protein